MKSLRRIGRLDAARAARRSSSEPPKCGSSVSTESAAAPPRSYAAQTSATVAPGAISPSSASGA